MKWLGNKKPGMSLTFCCHICTMAGRVNDKYLPLNYQRPKMIRQQYNKYRSYDLQVYLL